MSTTERVLEVDGLVVAFGGVRAVDDVSLTVEQGSLVSLIGPNGAGKTSIVNAVSGLTRQRSGRIHFVGADISKWSAHRRAGNGLLRTFQSPRVMAPLTVYENIALGRHRLGASGAFAAVIGSKRARREEEQTRAAVHEVAARLHLDEMLTKKASGLPGGILRRIEVARTLVADPVIVLLDEPLAGLEEEETDVLLTAVRDFVTNGGTALMIDHDVSAVLAASDLIAVLDQGRLLTIGDPATIRTDKRVIDAYLGAA